MDIVKTGSNAHPITNPVEYGDWILCRRREFWCITDERAQWLVMERDDFSPYGMRTRYTTNSQVDLCAWLNLMDQ